MRNQNQGKSPPEDKFGKTEKSISQEAQTNTAARRRMRLFHGGVADDVPRMYVDFANTDALGVVTFYLTDDATDLGVDIFATYRQVTARINSASALYVVGWARVGHTVTVNVNQVTIIAGALDFATPAVGVSVGVTVVGSA